MEAIKAEAIGFLIALITGALIVVGYTCIKLVRKVIIHTKRTRNLEDTIFWVTMSGYIFWKMFQTSYGQIRWQFVTGVILGCWMTNRIICRIQKRY